MKIKWDGLFIQSRKRQRQRQKREREREGDEKTEGWGLEFCVDVDAAEEVG